MKRQIVWATGGPCLLAVCLAGSRRSLSAQAPFPDPNANLPPEVFGMVSPFIPMQSTEAVHMGLVWKKDSQKPKILFHARFPEVLECTQPSRLVYSWAGRPVVNTQIGD